MKAQEEKRIIRIMKEAVLPTKGVADFSRPIQMHVTKEEEISMDIFLTVNYGTKIPALCWNVQKKAKEILKGCGYQKINEINIFVDHVKVPHF